MGFGAEGEGASFLKAWYTLRLKNMSEKRQGVDDSWKNETERLARIDQLQQQYRISYGGDYKDDGQSASDYENAIAKSMKDGIQFLNGKSDSWIFSPTTQALYAENRQLDLTIIAIRGSEFDEMSDVSTDANLLQKPFESMGAVHSGFYAAYKELDTQLLELLKAKSQSKIINVWFTGHSLGAAVATLFVAKIMLLHDQGELLNVHLQGAYTIGSPRVGNPVFARIFDELSERQRITMVRIRNHSDPVTLLPIGVFGRGGYWHVGSLAYFDKNGDLHQGDGWKEIEDKSDYRQFQIPTAKDHLLISYWQNLKRAFHGSLGTEKADCSLRELNAPTKPFHENPDDRS